MQNMTTGQRIASRRKLANLSQEDISRELGVSRQAVSKWESDAGLPDIDNLIKLSKRFGVSVGWILGTEQDPSFDPSTGLSDAQLKMVEQIVERSHPKPGRILALAAVFLLILTGFGLFFRIQLSALSEENAAAQTQIAALEQSNQALLTRMDSVSAALEQQARENDLLLGAHTKAHLTEDGQRVSLSFYLIPKLFQENAQAYLTILNPDNSIFETVSCQPLGKWYFCTAELPVHNGYRYSFLLATDSGYQEQSLDDVSFIRYFNELEDATRYHPDPGASVRTLWYASEEEYVFTQPIASPLIDFSDGYAGYEEVEAVLCLNGEVIFTQSLKEEFREHGGAYMRFESPYTPDIRVSLPQLREGDILHLEIQAHHYNGQVLTGTLEALEVVN